MDIGRDEKVGACWECGYSLRGLPAPRCPECGRVFDPADETTMNMGTEVGPARRWLMRPPGWPMHVLTAGAVLVSLWACAAPLARGGLTDVLAELMTHFRLYWYWREVGNMMADIGLAQCRFLIAATIWLVVGVIWVARRLARGITVKWLSKQKAATFAYWRRWLVTPMVFGLTVLICRSNFPVWAGFWVSKPWLEQGVRDARSAGHVLGRNDLQLHLRWLGIYPARFPGTQAHLAPGETWIYITSSGAFVYRDDEQPPRIGNDPFRWRGGSGTPHVRHLTGPWYFVAFGGPAGD